MTPTITTSPHLFDLAELLGAGFVMLVLLALFVAFGRERGLRRRAEHDRDIWRGVAFAAEERAAESAASLRLVARHRDDARARVAQLERQGGA
ncbi:MULTISPECIES: hypothetical protein [unclassified Agrococcus]|uniref:hypothetical protein n=1 Tax=unclassified Agrococcus TaxID=2615065 RepID=UPI00361B0CF4